MPIRDVSVEYDEGQVVRRAQQGDSEAFRALVDQYDRRLLYFLRRILNESEEAFDVAQEVWLRAFRNLATLRAPEAFRVWLYRISHDLAVAALRRRRREVGIDSLPEAAAACHDLPQKDIESADQIHEALRSLSSDHARVLTLHYLEAMSVDEIADVLGCSAGTVKSRLHYARAALRRRIEEQERV